MTLLVLAMQTTLCAIFAFQNAGAANFRPLIVSNRGATVPWKQ